MLDSVSLCLSAGEVRILAGENGAGKSTLVKMIAGIVRPSQGEVITSQNIGMVHQELSLVEDLSVLENLFLGKEQGPLGFIRRKEQIEMAEELFQELAYSLPLHAKVFTLSLPEKNMLEIMKMLISRPEIIILDEPTSSLSQNLSEILFRQIQKLKAQGRAIIYISHKMDELAHIADSITILRDGVHVLTESFHQISMEKIVSSMVGRDIHDFYPAKIKNKNQKTLLSLKNFSVAYQGPEYGREYYVVPSDFSIREGEILGFAGLEGAGHSEFLSHLFQNKNLWQNKKLAYMPNDRKLLGLITTLPIEFNLTLPFITDTPVGKFLKLNKLKQQAQNFVKKVKLKYFKLSDEVSTLSGGNQQKIVLAKWLMTEPDIILMDEPTRGVDIGAKSEIYSFIRNYVKKNKAVVLYSTEISELMGICDRILVFHQGKVTGEFTEVSVSGELQEKIMQRALGVINEYDSTQKNMEQLSNFKSDQRTSTSDNPGMYL